MGGCDSTRDVTDIKYDDEDKPKNSKEEILLEIRKQFEKIESYIYKLRNEDVHYKMTKMIFMLNAIKELTPVIKTLEESDDNYQYDVLKDKFNLLFENLWKGNKEKFYDGVVEISEFFTINHIPKFTLTPTPQ